MMDGRSSIFECIPLFLDVERTLVEQCLRVLTSCSFSLTHKLLRLWEVRARLGGEYEREMNIGLVVVNVSFFCFLEGACSDFGVTGFLL